MDRPAFVDTNIFLRHFLDDNPDQTPRATAYLQRIERGEVRAVTSETVVFETVFVVDRRQGLRPSAIRDLVGPIVALPGLHVPDKHRLLRALDTFATFNIPFADAQHAVVMESMGLSEIVSFDHHFDRIPGITRIEP